jgi:protein SCO1/2
MKKWFWYGVFFVGLTAAFLVAVFWDNDFWKKKLPVISYVKPFRFVNQDNVPFSDKDLLGKVTVVEFFFTTCKGICPKMNNNMKTVYEQFKDQADFQIAAHTCMPETDSVARLKFYADSLGINTRKWILLTGNKVDLYQAARSSYLLDDPKNNFEKIEDQFIHTQFFAVVDRKGQVRGQIFDGLKKKEVERMKEVIQELLDEKRSGGNFVNSIFTNSPK